MRHIQRNDLTTYLIAGRSIEQLLPSGLVGGLATVRFLRIDRERSGKFSVAKFESFDEGAPNFLDIYEFSDIDPDLPYGEVTSFDDPVISIEYACNEYGASIDNFVSAGMIQDEYKEKYHPEW
jgi:hypothetical protein